jgi:crossover junction endodeoxyribonuclease RuvC
MRIVGIDPGASGALVILDTKTNTLEVIDMPCVEVKRGTRNVRQVSAQHVVDVLADKEIEHAVIEKVGAMPGQGVSSMFAFGRAAGVVEGALAGLRIATTYVSPQEWQKHMRVIGGKDGSRSRASQLWPKQSDAFSRKKDDGRADAALIAGYGSKLMAGGVAE